MRYRKYTLNELFDNSDYESTGNETEMSMKEGPAYFRADLVTKIGGKIPLYNSAVNYRSDGKLYVMGMGYDITELISAEKH
jgi:hypothetical protein